MKRIICFTVFIAVGFAAPIDDYDGKLAANATRNAVGAPVGFGSVGGGTYGGAGGSVWTVWDPWALRDALNSDDPRIVNVRGYIDLTHLFAGRPGIMLHVGSRTSIIGGDRDALIHGGGLSIANSNQVIVQNLRIYNGISYQTGEYPDGNGFIISMVPGDFSIVDNIVITGSEHVWVDHCEFADDPWNAATAPQRRHDGLIDIVMGSNWITISHNIFRNHNYVTLVGNGDDLHHIDAGKLKVTFFANWYRGTNNRNPRVRFGEIHMLNNLFTDIRGYIIGVGTEASVFAERNTFINCRAQQASTVSGQNGNLIDVRNTMRSCSWSPAVPNNVRWDPMNYYNYRAIAMGDVEQYVRSNAGPWLM